MVTSRYRRFFGDGLGLMVVFGEFQPGQMEEVYERLSEAFAPPAPQAALPPGFRRNVGVLTVTMNPPFSFITSEGWRPLVELMDLSKLRELATETIELVKEEDGRTTLISSQNGAFDLGVLDGGVGDPSDEQVG
jgi:hypothetical protein